MTMNEYKETYTKEKRQLTLLSVVKRQTEESCIVPARIYAQVNQLTNMRKTNIEARRVRFMNYQSHPKYQQRKTLQQ